MNQTKPCPTCGGKGRVYIGDNTQGYYDDCLTCDGTGVTHNTENPVLPDPSEAEEDELVGILRAVRQGGYYDCAEENSLDEYSVDYERKRDWLDTDVAAERLIDWHTKQVMEIIGEDELAASPEFLDDTARRNGRNALRSEQRAKLKEASG